MPSAERKKRVQEALERVGMSHRMKHYPSQLSGGQQQRVAVARALVGDPLILLADEPTGNLDSANGEAVMSLLRELHAGGATICMVTHDPRYARVCGPDDPAVRRPDRRGERGIRKALTPIRSVAVGKRLCGLVEAACSFTCSKGDTKMYRPLHLAGAAIFAVTGACTLYAGGYSLEEFSQTYVLSGHGRIVLENLNGDVRITTWDRDEFG